CWYELVNSRQDCNWQDLVTLNEREVSAWVASRLSQYSSLYSVVDEYVFFACFGFWSDNPQYL
ncbi:hypothetical protein DN195_27185, partial [Salmonella enterica subsp. enterica serovar Panama]|nr:hypothetical protein [Salmonella enterica subsp. enterica serovar Panama]